MALEEHLTDDLRRPEYRGHPNPLRGHCYVFSEALFYILGGKRKGWMPQTCDVIRDGKKVGVHWFLINPDGGYALDPTAKQFTSDEHVLYAFAVGRGFLTKKPSKRTKELIKRARESLKRVGVNTSTLSRRMS